MTTYPSNQNRDWTATQAAPWQTPAPGVATMAAYFPPTQARATGSVPQAYGPAYGQAAMPQLAWSAEQPDFNAVPETYIAKQAWYKRPGVLALAAAGLVVAASAGLFGELHSSSGSAPVKPAAQSAPAPAAAPAPAPAPMPAAQPAAPSYRSSSQSTSGGGYSKPASHQAPPQSPPPPPAPPQQQPYQSGQSDPSQWNSSNSYWSNHRDDNSYRWQGDHDNRWNFQDRDHDSDNSRSSSDHDSSGSSSDHGSSSSSSDHGSDSHSDGNGNSK